jgi:uncharacterized SAM-binding protein YcdF (DUF218 family)
LLSAAAPGHTHRVSPLHRSATIVTGFVLCTLIGYVVAVGARIQQQAATDETHAADVIVVFGAAQYAGKPSPAYRARLDHAAELFVAGTAPIVITTGGAGGDPKHSEGQVGRDYLIARGIPESRLIAETQSDDTVTSTRRVAAIMRENGMHSCIAVSDGYHMYRVKLMMQNAGVTIYASPRADPHRFHPLATLEEVFKYTLWKLRLE